jgi:hypothetical protein
MDEYTEPMPIDIDTFERESAFESDETYAERILQFLGANDEQAFERDEIAEATGIDPNVVSAVLSRLKDRALVRHKAPYWAIGTQERLASASNLSVSLESLNETLGPEQMDDWEQAGSDDPHPSDRSE